MSVVIGSVLRYLERILKKIETGTLRFRPSLPTSIEYILVKLAIIGNRFEALVVYLTRKFSRYVNLLQISMLDSMIIASLLYGFSVLLLVIILLVLYTIGG